MTQPKKLFPEAINSHVAARYWYCAEECLLRAVEGIKHKYTKAMAGGTRGHTWLEQRPKSKSYKNVYARFEEMAKNSSNIWFDFIGLAARRQFQGTWVIAHPDDYDVLWKERQIRFIENKTITNPDWKRYLGPVAQQQLLISAWVFEPFINEINYDSAPNHYLYWWDRNDMWPLGYDEIPYNTRDVEKFLNDLFLMFRGQRDIIPPSEFKCRTCKTYKDHCGFWK